MIVYLLVTIDGLFDRIYNMKDWIHPDYTGFNAPSLPMSTFFFVKSANYHPRSNRRVVSWPTTRRPGQLCSQGDNRVHDRHPTIWVNRLLGNGSVSSSYALSPTNYVIRNAGSRRFFFYRVGEIRVYLYIVTMDTDVSRHPWWRAY